jgi:hypothetical protein
MAKVVGSAKRMQKSTKESFIVVGCWGAEFVDVRELAVEGPEVEGEAQGLLVGVGKKRKEIGKTSDERLLDHRYTCRHAVAGLKNTRAEATACDVLVGTVGKETKRRDGEVEGVPHSSLAVSATRPRHGHYAFTSPSLTANMPNNFEKEGVSIEPR